MQRTFGYCLLTTLLIIASQSVAQDGEAEDTGEADEVLRGGGERCLSLSRIRRTEVIDDETIAFYLGGGDIYINSLPRTCPGLERNERFMYEVALNRLCSTDSITVIEGFGVTRGPGFTCPLGEFFPVTEDTLAIMKDGGEAGGGSVEMKPVELPEPQSDDDDEEQAAD